MSSAVANITKARRAVHSDRVADADRGRARTAALPRLSLMVHKRDRAELAVTVAQAAELLVVSHQAVDQAILRGTLPAYQHDGRRYLLVADLAETPAARRQAAEIAQDEYDQAMAHYRVVDSLPAWMLPAGTPPPAPCPPTCRLCRREGRQPVTVEP